MSIITLTTDFGSKDYYVALLKGHILRAFPKVTIIDITHDISAHDIMEGAFFLKSTYNSFPKGTIHFVGVNTFYDSANRLLVFNHDDFTFIGPNNGLFSLVLTDLVEERIIEIADQDLLDIYDVVENVMQGLSAGSPISKLGRPVERFETKINLQPVISPNQIRATIMYVDHFGNVIVNLSKNVFEEVRQNRNFAIYYKSDDPVLKLSNRYNNVMIGDVCAFFNSIDLLEIAIRMGNASELLGLNKTETIQIDFF